MTEEELIEYIFIRNMVANIFKEVVENDAKRKTTNDRR